MAVTTNYAFTKPSQGASGWATTMNENLDAIDAELNRVSHLSGTKAWNPASVNDGAMTSTTLTVTGACIGDPVAVGFANAVPAGALLVGSVTAANTVTATLFNKTGGALDLASGTLKAIVWSEYHYTVTTTGAETHTIASLGVSSETTIYWGDGASDAYTGTAARTHDYAAAGTWRVRISHPLFVTEFNMSDSKVTLNSNKLTGMSNMTTFTATGVKAGTFDSADVSAWRPTTFQLYSMPAGYAGTFDSADVSAWRPTTFRLHSMPIATYTIAITVNGFAAWSTGLTDFQMQDNSLNETQVDAILWDLYQAASVPRTASAGTINVGGTNAAPSGVYQACASCPVTVATPGKEIAHELINDGCTVGFNTWTTVTTT